MTNNINKQAPPLFSKPSEDSECNLKENKNTIETVNKPKERLECSPSDKPTSKELELMKELEKYKKIVNEYEQKLKDKNENHNG